MYKTYTDWMKSNGAKFDKIDIKYFYKDYRGIVAKEDIAKGENIIFVPLNGMITLRTAKSGVIGKKLAEKKVGLIYPNNSTLSTYVLSEIANPKSTWKLLFKALPRSVDNFPIFFTKAEKALLKGSPFLGTGTYQPAGRHGRRTVPGHED